MYSDITGGTFDSTVLNINGLPFTNNSTQEAAGNIMFSNINVSSTITQLSSYITTSASYIRLYESHDSASWNPLTTSNISASTAFFITISYHV